MTTEELEAAAEAMKTMFKAKFKMPPKPWRIESQTEDGWIPVTAADGSSVALITPEQLAQFAAEL